MLKFLGICLLIYLAYRLIRWACRSGRNTSGRSSRSGGGGFFDGFDLDGD